VQKLETVGLYWKKLAGSAPAPHLLGTVSKEDGCPSEAEAMVLLRPPDEALVVDVTGQYKIVTGCLN